MKRTRRQQRIRTGSSAGSAIETHPRVGQPPDLRCPNCDEARTFAGPTHFVSVTDFTHPWAAAQVWCSNGKFLRQIVMSVTKVLICSLAIGATACSTVGQLTVKDYKSKTGERVLAGQAEPKAEYRCEKVAEEPQPWGIAGNMNRAGTT